MQPIMQPTIQPTIQSTEPRIPRTNNSETSRDDRIAIQTALKFKIPHLIIQEALGVTRNQIQYARNHRVTPQKSKSGRGPLIRTPQRKDLENWLHASPSHCRIPYRYIPQRAPELQLQGIKEKAIKTAFDLLGYCRRTAKKKGFSDDPAVRQERDTFAQEALQWTKERVYAQMFTDEVWAIGGAHTTSYVIVKQDGSDRDWPENLQHKYSKAPAWMFHGSIVRGRKGPAVFWEKEWGTMNSSKYN